MSEDVKTAGSTMDITQTRMIREVTSPPWNGFRTKNKDQDLQPLTDLQALDRFAADAAEGREDQHPGALLAKTKRTFCEESA